MLTEARKKSYVGTVAAISQAAKDLFYITINAPYFSAKPGQFISVQCADYTLRRPFSIMDFYDDKITILFKLKGKGTKYISELSEGDKINFSGPFGNGFTIEQKKSLLIAAGVGIAPIYFLKKELNSQNIENRLIAGFVGIDAVVQKNNIDLISTDDGSYGNKGSILQYIAEEIKNYNPEKIYACGPSIVLKNICQTAANLKIETEIAMEKEMACSIGVCRGCVIELQNGQNASVCKDGPVFKGSEIKW